ncbi:MAG: helix-turn-helix domain-containing protein [Oscillospiraceae bacterium]|nr:helix-turn-helix domain-containing protein [Oscillospiraceae bacterium]
MVNQGKHTLLPYEIILLATSGDSEAIHVVLAHYEKYISALSTRAVRTEEGMARVFLDAELQHRLENKLISRILAFDASMISGTAKESMPKK